MSTLDLAEPSYPDPVADAAFDDIHAYPSPDEKRLGAYYTPQGVAEALTQWATSDATPCDVLDPSCGDGRFLVGVERGTGIDIDVRAVEQALTRVPTACIIHTDFFSWAERTERRFDAVVGNPPFIRYQSFTAEMRERALAVCAQRGVALTGLSSSWAPFIVAAVSLLRDGGSAAFVVPSEIGHAVYARPVLEFLLARFARVEVIAIRQKLFPNLSEDCWLLRAAGWGGTAVALHIARVETFEPDVPPSFEEVGIVELRAWNLRLRPLLLSPDVRAAYLGQPRLDELFDSGAWLGLGSDTCPEGTPSSTCARARRRGSESHATCSASP